MQTPHEVVDSLLRGRPAERYGFNDQPWGDTVRKWVREEGYPTDEDGNYINPNDHFQMDFGGVPWFQTLPLRDHREVIEETDEWHIIRNGAGALLKWWKERSGTPEHIGFTMTSREVWERDYRSHLLDLDMARLDVEKMREAYAKTRAAKRWMQFGNLFIWELMRASMGDVTMYESLVLDPEWVKDFNRVYTDFYIRHLAAQVEAVGQPDGFWIYEDLGYSKGLFCSVDTLAELIFPYYAEVIDWCHARDIPVVLHSCGYIEDAIPLIVDAGFDGLNPMEVKAGCDVLRFARDWGDQLCFFGGLDARVLERGDPAEIEREVIRLIEGMKDLGARWVFGSDHSISTNVTYAAFSHAVNVYREHCWL